MKMSDERQYIEDDVVRWRFSENTKFRSNNRYWCKSQFAILNKKGMFADTFWHGGDKFVFEPNSYEVELTYLGNLNDYEPCGRDVFRYYRAEDIMDISHSNDSKAIYLRRGAKKNAAVMFAAIEKEIQDAQSKSDWYSRRVQQLKETRIKLQTEEDVEGIYI